ncbi:flavodoxin reductase family protein [Rhizobium sp. CF142]|nr:flavodoxin reductase family protein [Rhizobium sp. CF142]
MERSTLALWVTKRNDEAHDIISLELVSPDGVPLPAFTAGSHVDLYVGNGLIRQYSLCNDPAERHRYVLGILKDPSSRGGSCFLHEQVGEGATILVGAPRCNFPLVETAGKSILIAGGIGITPMLAMAYRLTALGKRFSLHYCGRSIDRIAFREVLESGPLASSSQFHLDDGDTAQRFSFGDDIGLPEEGSHIYVCGPEGFINHALQQAYTFGWPDGQLHVEFFRAEAKAVDGDQAITVTAARSGVTVEVDADRSIASVLMDHGVDIPVACEQGICGTCVTSIIDGEPLHRDDCLSDAEKASNKVMTICCSRAKTKHLVLDI